MCQINWADSGFIFSHLFPNSLSNEGSFDFHIFHAYQSLKPEETWVYNRVWSKEQAPTMGKCFGSPVGKLQCPTAPFESPNSLLAKPRVIKAFLKRGSVREQALKF